MQLPHTGTWRELVAWILTGALGAAAAYTEMRRGETEVGCAQTVERAVAAQRDKDTETLKIVVEIAQGRL